MAVHMQPPQTWLEVPESLRPWRSQYPKFGELIDAGASPLKALRYLGLALWQDGRLNDAARILKTAVASAPDQPQILTELGSVLCAAGRSVEAAHYLKASLELDPRQLHVWINLAGLYHQSKETGNAEHAYLMALELQPESAEAAAGLGLLFAEQRLFDQAAGLLTAAIARGATAPAVYACLGQTLYQLGDYANAAAALGNAARALPDCAPIVRKYAEARLIELAIGGTVEHAVQAYASLAGSHAEDLDAVCRRTFQTLCVYGPAEAAIRVGEGILRCVPDDPIIGYHLDALRGRTHPRAPSAYLTACFDRFAANFEHHLVDVLNYRIPEKAYPLLVATEARFARILDLGCGTGLAAPYLSKLGGRLVGVDLSPRMLEKAQARETYSQLVEDEAVSYLADCGEQFDLIAAFDVVVYFGDLAGLLAAVASRLDRGGIFAFSFETGQDGDYTLLASGRFAHDAGYVERMCAEHFTAVASVSTMVRLEANRPVAGQLVLVRRL
jgi:predicted TPR repeat methyltransferase